MTTDISKKKFEPKVGQYYYEKSLRGTRTYWLVMLRQSETFSIQVEKYYEDEKAIQRVSQLNGWTK